MTDTHRHEWGFIEDGPGCEECHYSATIAVAECDCGAVMGPSQMERKLDAVECLSEVQARILAGLTSPKHKWNVPQTSAQLAAVDYAKALEEA